MKYVLIISMLIPSISMAGSMPQEKPFFSDLKYVNNFLRTLGIKKFEDKLLQEKRAAVIIPELTKQKVRFTQTVWE